MLRTLECVAPILPEARPRYLMGVGKPMDLVEAVARGVDLFDCVLPTRSGRHGQAWSDAGPLNLKNALYAEDKAPLDPTLDCPASRDHSKAYLHHLVKAEELLGQVLLSWHNLAYYQGLMRRLRAAIAAGRLAQFAEEFRRGWGA
jgi:queuine tRNA-ribosyltransferase